MKTSNHRKMQSHSAALQQQFQVIVFLKNGRNYPNICQFFSSMLLCMTVIGLPSNATARDSYSSSPTATSIVNNSLDFVEDNPTNILISNQWHWQYTEKQREWAEQQAEQQREWAEQQREWVEPY